MAVWIWPFQQYFIVNCEFSALDLALRPRNNFCTPDNMNLLTWGLIRPSNLTRATIFFKVFFPQIMSNNSCFPSKRRILVSSRTFSFQAGLVSLTSCLESILMNRPMWNYCPYCLPRTLGVQTGNNFEPEEQTGH